MDIIISHKSALEYWREYRRLRGRSSGREKKTIAVAKVRRTSPPAILPSINEIRDRVPSELSYPINLLVGNKNTGGKSAFFQPRVYSGKTSDGCFAGIGDGLAVSAPPFCFFQMAGELPLVKLIELGFELCGTYSLLGTCGQDDKHSSGQDDKHLPNNWEELDDRILHGDRELVIDRRLYNDLEETAGKTLYANKEGIADNTSYGLPQLTNTKALKAFTARMEGVSGRKMASRALRYIADGSASPMETILFMLLTLPNKLGGYGLPAPVLNKRINTGNAAKGRPGSGNAYYVCDLFWPEARIAVEYDSYLHHTGADRIASDAKKRLDYKALGITPFTVTIGQVRDEIEFEGFAKLIARELHKQLRCKDPQFLKAKNELRRLLL